MLNALRSHPHEKKSVTSENYVGNRLRLRNVEVLKRKSQAMRDFELHQALLGLRDPWKVITVDLNRTRQRVAMTVDAGTDPHAYPEYQLVASG